MTPRLLCDLPPAGGLYQANPEQSHYLLKVLRLNPSDPVELFDGRGLRFSAEIFAIEGKTAQISAQAGLNHWPRRPYGLWIAQGLPSGDKMDWIIEKAVELGVERFSPLECERSIVKLTGPRLVKKMSHWHHEIEAACMQSQRDDLMILDEVQPSERWLAAPRGASLKLALDPSGKLGALDALRAWKAKEQLPIAAQALSRGTIVLAIGPESGFSNRERGLAERAGFEVVSLGNQVLRTETAALVAAAKVQAWLELL
jgi:16S rRNA (uracil1498-N3)-methyltransferase